MAGEEIREAADETPADGLKADCYSAGERGMMVFFQRVRGVMFAPLLRWLDAARVKPDQLTLMSCVAGLAFCPLFFIAKPIAFLLLALHVALDGLDGPLARYQNVASRKGSFTDTMADQVVIVATTAAVMAAGMATIAAGMAYAVVYTVVALFAMARNYLERPYSWLLRPRFYVYAWFLVECYWKPGTLNIFLWVCTAILGIKAITGFIGIRRRL
jgi:phosphatidylglycerophosphate synthase